MTLPDVLVVGGGPAGLVTALECRRQGLGVLLVDRSHPPRDKACGEGLMPGAVRALARLGIDAAALGCPFAGIRYLSGARTAHGAFREGCGVGVRRTTLQAQLAQHAEEAGVELRWDCRVEGIEAGLAATDRRVRVSTSEGPLEAHYLVAADGLLSPLRRAAGLAAPPARRRRFGVRRHYRIAPWTDCVEVTWQSSGEAYVTPVDSETVGVAMLWSGSKANFDRRLAVFPRLRERLQGAEITSRDRGAGPFEQRARSVVCGRLALVGDAAGYLDAITGEGIGLALRQSAPLAEALANDNLDPYRRSFPHLGRRVRLVTRALLRLRTVPPLRHGLVTLFAASPRLFSQVLGWMEQ